MMKGHLSILNPLNSSSSSVTGTCISFINNIKYLYNSSNNKYYSTTTTTSKSGNKVYSWGSGSNGKLGHGLMTNKLVEPKEIIIEDSNDNDRIIDNIEAITSGTTFSLFSKFDKEKNRQVYYGCGDNKDAQLIIGNGKIQTIDNIQSLDLSEGVSSAIQGKQMIQLTSGTYHSGSLFEDGTTLLWGSSNSGQIGSPIYNRVQFDPYNNKKLFEISISKLSMGATFTIALSKDGKLYSFGSSSFNELGNGDMYNEREPKLISNQLLNQHHIIDIACGFFHTIALTSDNKILTWGRNQESQCMPVPDRIGKGSFVDIQFLDTSINDDGKIIQIGASNFNSYILTDSGNIYSIGSNDHGQCGIEKSNFIKGKLNKVLIDGQEGQVVKFYSNFKTVIVETKNGKFYGWGSNFDHQLSLEPRSIIFKPTELHNLTNLNQNSKILDISISLSHCISITQK